VFVPIPRAGEATNRLIAPAAGSMLPVLPMVGLGLLALAAVTLLIVLLVR
jgi:VIT1/CCC1 family predicted Fe2+/Mn2+ transporter